MGQESLGSPQVNGKALDTMEGSLHVGHKKIAWGKEIAQTGNEIAGLARDVGVPSIGLLGRFAQHFYDKHLQRRFERFIAAADLDTEFIDKVASDETYSNCFYAILETVRQTHSKIGLSALAHIYRDHWNNEPFLIAASQSFAQISDKTIDAFIDLYESIQDDKDYLVLNSDGNFHEHYNEAVELIRRNFFIMSTGASMHANGPVQGMKWEHTDSYYEYCKAAKARV